MRGSSKRGPRVFTIGHSNRTFDDFIRVLKLSGISMVADIRSNPVSVRYPHFERFTLSNNLESENISYRWFRSLGGRVSSFTDASEHQALPEVLRNYASRVNHDDFTEEVHRLLGLCSSVTTVLMCAELDFKSCHRWVLSDRLVLLGAQVVHLIDDNVSFDHELNPDLEEENGVIVYRKHQLSLFPKRS